MRLFTLKLYSFTLENKIILPFHHGGLKNHGTDTALATILDNLYKQKENDKITCILQTDLSSAYDTIDHSILLKKLDFYGVRGKSLELISNYLCDRKQFVVLHTFKSKILPALQCSVIQGSKLLSLLHILYTNEIPMLYKFLNDDNVNENADLLTDYKFKQWVGEIKNSGVEQLTINFIDDSTNLISNKNYEILIKYLSVFYYLLKTSSQSETIPSPPLPLMEVTIKQEHSLNIVKHC